MELLALLNHFQIPVLEVPVDWSDIAGSKISLIRDAWRLLCAVHVIHDRMKTGFR